MNFKQLEYFSAVAEAKSISKAARALHVAQPPISRQLSMLEDELGVCLFLRNNKGVELTVEVQLGERSDIVNRMLDIEGVHNATLIACQSEAGN